MPVTGKLEGESMSKDAGMTGSKLCATTLLLAMVLAVGQGFGLFPAAALADGDEPTITAKIHATALDTIGPNRITLPATITFTATEPVVIYYTTNGELPSTFRSASATVTDANTTVNGPTITSTDYMLMVQGVDATGSLTPLLVYTFTPEL
jgi:hypothetical protein